MWPLILLLVCDLSLFALAIEPLIDRHGITKQAKYHRSSRFSAMAFCVTLAATLLLCRAPWILAGRQFNPDESSFLAVAARYSQDIVPWRGTASGTSGPLTPWLLTAISAIGLPLSYPTAHMTAVVIQILVLIMSYRACQIIFSELAARWAVMPVGIWLAHTANPEFLFYSSELLPVLLLSASTWAAGHAISGHRRRCLWLFIAGVLSGAVSFAKLQAVPMALVCSVATLTAIWHTSPQSPRLARHLGSYSAGALLVPLVIVGMVIYGAVWNDFVEQYLIQNLAYGAPAEGALTLWERCRRAIGFILWPQPFAAMTIQGVACVGITVAAILSRRITRAEITVTGLQLLGIVAYGAAALYGILRPGTEFFHYLLLLLPPFMLATAMAAHNALLVLRATARKTLLCTMLVVVCGSASYALGLAAYHGGYPYHEARVDIMLWMGQARAQRSREAMVITALATLDDEVAVWGFRPDIYVETGRRPAVRDVETSGAIKAGPLQRYYQSRFLEDMRRHRPRLFVDAVCHASWLKDKLPHGHPLTSMAVGGYETFPALSELVDSEYELREVVGYPSGPIRIFCRR